LGELEDAIMDRKPTYNELELRVKELEKELQNAKQGEIMSRETENIKEFLKLAPFGLYLIDLSGKIVACNETGAKRLEKTIETAVGTVLRDYFPTKVSENRRLKGMEAIQSRKAVTFEDQAEGRWYRNSIFPIFGEDGRPVRLAIYGSDVTEYKDALDALEKSEEKYKQLSDSLPQVVFETDESGNIIFANRVAFDLFGYTRDGYGKGLSALQMLIPEDRERAAANIQKTLKGEKFGGMEYTALTKDGRTYPVMLYSNPVVRDGNAVGLRGIIVDLTEVKRAEKALRESEEKYRRIYENSVVGFFQSTPEGRFLHVNPALARMLRYESPEDLVSSIDDIASTTYANPTDRRRYHEALKANGHVEDFQFKARCKDGSEVWISDSSRAYFDEDGELTLYEGIVVDITERRRAEEALRESEARLRTIFNTSSDGILVFNAEGVLVMMNPSAARMYGYHEEEMIGLTGRDIVHPDYRHLFRAFIRECSETGHFRTESVDVHKDGSAFNVEVHGSLFEYKGEQRLLAIVRDMTLHKQAEEDLRESEEKLQIRNRIASVFLTKTDEEMYPEILELVLDELKSRFGVFGYIDNRGSLVCPSMTKTIWDQCQMPEKDIVFPEDTWGDSIWGNGLRTKKSAYSNRLFKVPEGHIPIGRCLTAPLVFQNRSIGLLTVANKDTDYDESDKETLEAIAEYVAPLLQGILVKNAMKKSLQESEERYRILVEESPLGVSLIGKDGRYQYLNPKFMEIFGYTLEEIPTGKEWFRQAYRDEKYRREVLAAWMDDLKRYGIGEGRSRTYLATCKNGSRKVIHFRTVTMEGGDQMVIYEDVTETHRLEERLRRSQKMEALGLLAGGVAHDLNNILSGIVSYPELILMDLPEGSPLRKPMKTIHESGMRAAGVVSDLLTIARGVAIGKEALNLNTIVTEYMCSAEFQTLAKTNTFVHFKSEPDPHLLNMRGSAIHLKKTLMNLVTNASEAIEGEGTVTISTFNRYLDEPLKGHDNLRTGEYVVLSVSDNGRGISGKDMERIFEPFYTKKVMGRSGTGLGLAVVWNTVQDHNGYIDVRTSEKGTVFELYFPVTRKEIATAKEPVDLKERMGHGENILVVDDEESQREIATDILTKLGYHAKAVSSGEEAIDYVKEHLVDLIVLDMVMPKGINGREAYEEIIKIRPGQKAIIASGYAQTEEVDAAQKLGAGKYIKKPYTLEKIGVAVKEELEK
jgi:PAS domain S-box-containing protein